MRTTKKKFHFLSFVFCEFQTFIFVFVCLHSILSTQWTKIKFHCYNQNEMIFFSFFCTSVFSKKRNYWNDEFQFEIYDQHQFRVDMHNKFILPLLVKWFRSIKHKICHVWILMHSFLAIHMVYFLSKQWWDNLLSFFFIFQIRFLFVVCLWFCFPIDMYYGDEKKRKTSIPVIM